MTFIKISLPILFIGLVVMGLMLVNTKEQSIPETYRIVAGTDLQPLTLLNEKNLEPRSPDKNNLPDIKGLSDRYVLVSVKKGAEIKDEMVAPRDATALLSDAVAVSVPAGATTVVGNQLRAGDLVDVLIPKGTEVKKYELMVLVPASKDSTMILLAVPSAQRFDFASALVGTQLLLISRKIVATKPS